MARMTDKDYNSIVTFDDEGDMTVAKSFRAGVGNPTERHSLRDMVKRYNDLTMDARVLYPYVYDPESFDAKNYAHDVRRYTDVTTERVQLEKAIHNRIDRLGHLMGLWDSPRDVMDFS